MSALEEIRRRVTIDIDQLDPTIARELGPFHDMTSNQALIAGVVIPDPDQALVGDVIAKVKKANLPIDEAVDLALDLFAVLLAKAVLPHITGRVHAQLSPRYSHSASASLAHGHRLISLFESNGIRQDRVCLKIPTTGAGMAAAAKLESTGIQTLATTLFSMDQALAAVQAECLYIAPYFNELSTQFEPETWKEYGDTAREHPMAQVISRIVELYQGMERRPLVMPAWSWRSRRSELDHITVPGKILKAMAEDEDVKAFRGPEMDVAGPNAGVAPKANGKEPHPKDFLADEGSALDESIAADENVSRRLSYALKAFGDCEQKVMDLVRSKL